MDISPDLTSVPHLTPEQILEDYCIAYRSRQLSLIARKDVMRGRAKFGAFGDGKELPEVAMARFFQHGDFRSGYYRDQTLMMALGEITVLAIAAAGIFAMLRGIRLRTPPRDLFGRRWSPDAHPVILAMLSRPLLPMALLVAFFMLLRGHHEPGGGFIAGLIAGIALILQQLASGQQWSAERLRLNYTRLIGAGLILALGTGLAALVFGRPFLTSAFWHGAAPLLGELEFASAMAFDTGVFLVVLGTVMLILDNLGRLSGHRQHGHRPGPNESGNDTGGAPWKP